MNPYLRISQLFNDTSIIYRKLILRDADWPELPESKSEEWPQPRVELIKEIGWSPANDYAVAEMGLWLGNTLVVRYPIFLWLKVEGLKFTLSSTSPESAPSGLYYTGNPILHLRDPDVYTLDAAGGVSIDLVMDEPTAIKIDELMNEAYEKWTPKIPDDLNDMKDAFRSAFLQKSIGLKAYRTWAFSKFTDSDSYIDFAFIWIPRKGYVPVYLAGHKDPNGRITKAENATFDPAVAVQDALNLLTTDFDMLEFLPTQEEFMARVKRDTNELREELDKGEET